MRKLVEGMPDVQGLVFDCDGTLADTMPLHYLAWIEELAVHGLTLSEDEFYAMGGWPTLVVARHLLQRGGCTADPEQVRHDKESRFERLLSQVQPIPPVIEVARAYQRRVPMGVATGGMAHICRQILDQIQATELFNAIVTCEDVARHKPDPDIFLEAARRIGVKPEFCVAFEDTNPGVTAARSAGMRVIDVRDFYQPRRISST